MSSNSLRSELLDSRWLNCRDFSTFELDTKSDHDWTAVLKVAHSWDCPTIKALAVERLEAILSASPDDSYFRRLSLACMYSVEPWIETALGGLCARRSALTEEEIAQMRPADVRRVMEGREAELREVVARATQEAQTLGAKSSAGGAADRGSCGADQVLPSLKVEDEPGKATDTVNAADSESATDPTSLSDSGSATACSER